MYVFTGRFIKSEVFMGIEAEKEVRLNKYLSDSGLCSRRKADEYIDAGYVTINGAVATMGTKVRKGDIVAYKGKTVGIAEELVVLAFNKPRGIVCTTDKREKNNIVDYINYSSRIYPVGRLDKDSEGLILMTNNGDIADKILRSRNNHEKEYEVSVDKEITKEFIEGMRKPVPILDTFTKESKVIQTGPCSFRIIITQGLNRQIRRMCEYFGYRVMKLKRVRIINVSLGNLKKGQLRKLTKEEEEGLFLTIGYIKRNGDKHD